MRFWIELNNQRFLALVCTYLAQLAMWTEELDQAARWLAQSLAYHADPRSITIYEVEQFWVTARLATAQQQYPRAVTLFGLADQIHSQVHYAIGGPILTLADAALVTVRAQLAQADFDRAFATGQQLSLAEAFETILRPG